jgi:hypothetical protein
VPQDVALAREWFHKADEQGNAAAQLFLRIYYEAEIDRRAPESFPEAVAWFRKAAEKGNANAQAKLGYFYYSGYGMPQDYAQALTWWRKAAEHDDVGAQLKLGNAYYKGQGVPQDYPEAYFWLDLASAGKLDDSDTEQAVARIRDKVASYMTPADLSSEQERARKWFEAHQVKTK